MSGLSESAGVTTVDLPRQSRPELVVADAKEAG
ncbi:MAG: hypothetical protein JWR69_3773 [Pedosphaera sp.]|nr:hypothetical protein [Pedosphaera sp.]